MPHTTFTRWQKATALVPLALLSGAWTSTLAAQGFATASAESADGAAGRLPDGTRVPTQAIEAPASVSNPAIIAPGVPDGSSDAVVQSASVNGIPAAALAAYQRAAQVINAADKGCHMPWELVAAIGRVESDHGRYGGNVLTSQGKSKPGIYGIPLDGSNGTAKIPDTDAGEFDNDKVYDRAVGPMQFIPSTWSVVGVDADGDGVRDPQDIDDAALATAVYLCSGNEDLSGTAGQRSAVYRYNHSDEYVDLVLSIMAAYMNGNYSAVPNGTTVSTTFYPTPTESVVTAATKGKQSATRPGGHLGSHHGGGGGGTTTTPIGSTGGGGGGGGTTPLGGGGGTGGTDTPSTGGTTNTVKDTTNTVKDTTSSTVKDTTDTVDSTTGGTTSGTSDTVNNTLTKAEATAQCLADDPLLSGSALDACVANLMG